MSYDCDGQKQDENTNDQEMREVQLDDKDEYDHNSNAMEDENSQNPLCK